MRRRRRTDDGSRRVRACAALLPLLLVAALAGPARAEPVTVASVLAELSREPTIEEVQIAAMRQAALEPELARSFSRRVRWAGLLPHVEVSLARGMSRDEGLDRAFQEPDELSLDTDDELDFRCAVRWDLDRLVYDPEELRASREATDLSRRRRELLLAVTRMYYELLLLRARARLPEPEEPGAALERELRISELTALLDGLTGGVLSRSAR